MRRRLGFIGQCLMRGVKWLNSVLGTVGNVLLAVALVAGVTVAVTLLHAPASIVVPIVCLVVLAVFAEGAYQVWNDAELARAAVLQGHRQRATVTAIELEDVTDSHITGNLAKGMSLLRAEGGGGLSITDNVAVDSAMPKRRGEGTGFTTRRRRRREAAELAALCQELADELFAFLAERRLERPFSPPLGHARRVAQTADERTATWQAEITSMHKHAEETMTQYGVRFASRTVRLYRRAATAGLAGGVDGGYFEGCVNPLIVEEVAMALAVLAEDSRRAAKA